jgi:hypothetical protein
MDATVSQKLLDTEADFDIHRKILKFHRIKDNIF